MQPIGLTLLFILEICWYLVIIQVILSWLVNFEIINLRQKVVYNIWNGLGQLTEPVYRPIRRYMPDMGGLDLSPIVVLVAIFFLQQVVVSYLLGAPASV